MSSGRPFLDLARWTAECVSVDFNYFGQFCIFEEPWEFFKPSSRPCQLFTSFFKLSHLPDHAGWQLPLYHAMPGRHIQFFWLGKGCWATAQALGQLPLWIFEHYVANFQGLIHETDSIG